MSDLHILNFNKYTRKPIKENIYLKWVMNGELNENYQYIIDRYNGSTTNKAVNNAYIDLAYGRGLSIHDKKEGDPEIKLLNELISPKDTKAIVSDYQILGELAFVIHRQRGNKKKIAKIEHIAKAKVIPSVSDENNEIRSYWYSLDWKNKHKAKNRPINYPAFGFAEDFNYELPEIYVGRPYCIGQEYFGLPDYDACLQYAEIEEEISNYYISHIKNGLSFGTIINVPNSSHWEDNQKKEYKDKINNKLSGSSNAGEKVINFGAGDSPTTITNVENNTAHKQWDFLTNEASMKIISGHKCMSPMLVGLGTASGFNSKADEMDMMEQQLMKRVIAPKQDFILDCFLEVLNYFGISLDIYFRPLTEIEGEKEEIVKVNENDIVDTISMSKKKSELDKFIDLGEDEDLGTYELISCKPVDYEEEINLASTGTARPLYKSRYDLYDTITRYRYAGEEGQREFCKKMMSARKIYRIEDIEVMKKIPVNAGFGPEGANTYDIFKYKGGVNCYHFWEKLTYRRKYDNVKVDVKSPIAIDKSRKTPAKGLAGVEPINMPNRGALN